MTEKIRNIGMLDINGTVLSLLPGNRRFLVDRPITPEFMDNLNKSLHELPPGIVSARERFNRIFLNLFNTRIEDSGKAPYDPSFDQFFNGHILKSETTESIFRAYLNGLEMTLISGMPYGSISRLTKEIAPILKFLSPTLRFILNPVESRFSGINSKMIFPGIFPDCNVFPWEDDIVAALWLKYRYNLRIYLSVTEDEAMNQPHLDKLPLPPNNTNGDLKFNSSVDTIIEDMLDNNFSNIPLI